MAEYLAPGVYVEEFSSNIKPMEGVSTSTVGFIGMTQRGPVRGVPQLIISYMEFQRIFGDYLPQKEYGNRRFLPMAVEQFFANGGSRCFITRLLDENEAETASTDAGEAEEKGNLRFTASSPGSWGNQVAVRCLKGPQAGRWSVVVAEGTVYNEVERYQDVTLDPEDDNNLCRLLEKSLLVRAEYTPAGTEEAPADLMRLMLALGGNTSLVDEIRKADGLVQTALTAEQASAGALKQAGRALDAANADLDTAPDDTAKQQIVEQKQKAVDEAAAALQTAQESRKKAEAELAALTPEETVVRLQGGRDCGVEKKPFESVNVSILTGEDGGPGLRTGLCALEDVPEVSIVVAPGVTDLAESKAVVTHCEKMLNRVCILDMPEDESRVPALREYRLQFDSSYAAMYQPWIEVYGVLEKKPVYMPPSGSVAGVYARSDSSRGVHKAPANEVIRNCTGLRTLFGNAEQDMLNPVGVNLIRNIQGLGIRVWGTRTCSSDSDWKYINLRRLFIYIEETIRRNTAWAVSEPNDQLLWTKVRGTITSFLGRLWRDGALCGASEAEAYFVQIGKGSTMTDDDILNGRLICAVGVAPVRPGEFVSLRITHIMEQNR